MEEEQRQQQLGVLRGVNFHQAVLIHILTEFVLQLYRKELELILVFATRCDELIQSISKVLNFFKYRYNFLLQC